MRVLFFTQYFPPEVGAAQTRLDALTRGLVALGHTVDIVTAMPSYPTEEVFEGYRGAVFRREQLEHRSVLRTWALPAIGTGRRRIASYAAFALSGFVGLVRSHRPDVIFVESPPLTLAVPGITWARARNVPVVFNVADLWPDAAVSFGALSEGRTVRVLRRLEAWTYSHSQLVSTVTPGLVDALIERKRLPTEKVFLLPNGVDIEMFSPVRGDDSILQRLDIPAGPLLVYAGTMGIAHGIGPLIDAVAGLDGPGGPILLMIGSGTERARYERLVADRGVTNIVFRDAIPPSELADLLPHAALGIVTVADLPINSWTRPAKLFPLMASGLAVLHAGVGDGADCLVVAGGGVVVPNEAAAIANAVNDLLNDPAKRALMGKHGREYVEANWSWSSIVRSLSDRLESMVQRSHHPSGR